MNLVISLGSISGIAKNISLQSSLDEEMLNLPTIEQSAELLYCYATIFSHHIMLLQSKTDILIISKMR